MSDTITNDQLVAHIRATVDATVAEAVDASIKKADEARQTQVPTWFQAFEAQKAAEAARKDIDHLGRYLFALAAAGGRQGDAIDLARKQYTGGVADALVKTLTASTFTAGGAAVPTQDAADIIEFLRPASVIRRLSPTVLPMPNGNLTIPKLTGGATATYIAEAANAVASQGTTGTLQLSAKKLITIVPISNDLLRFANPQLDTMIRQDAITAMANRQDLAFIRGDGLAGVPRGLRSWCLAANVETTTAGNALAAVTTNLGTLMADLLNADVRMLRPAWLMHPRTYIFLTTIRDGNGNFAFRPEMLSGGNFQGTLWGYPYGLTTQIPINLAVTATDESEIYFVDMADCVIADAVNMTVEVVNGAAYYSSAGTLTGGFSRDETILKIVSEHDFGMRHDASVAYLQDADWF
ncbi:MAG: phage major capsid protein [Gallionellaceae bacterium]|nr:phage major capsid protein [Gallionellaceae bacterium]